MPTDDYSNGSVRRLPIPPREDRERILDEQRRATQAELDALALYDFDEEEVDTKVEVHLHHQSPRSRGGRSMRPVDLIVKDLPAWARVVAAIALALALAAWAAVQFAGLLKP